MRLVDADEIIESLSVDPIECLGCPEPEWLEEFIEILNNAPTAAEDHSQGVYNAIAVLNKELSREDISDEIKDYLFSDLRRKLWRLAVGEPAIVFCKDCAKHNIEVGDFSEDENGRHWYWKDEACPLIAYRGKAQGHEFDYQFCACAKPRYDNVLAELEDLLDEYSELDESGLHDPKWCGVREAYGVVKNASSAIKAEWKHYSSGSGCYCSNCGWDGDDTIDECIIEDFDFCPNCGAVMGGHDDNA